MANVVNLKDCPQCGTKAPDSAKTCPQCGYVFPTFGSKFKKAFNGPIGAGPAPTGQSYKGGAGQPYQGGAPMPNQPQGAPNQPGSPANYAPVYAWRYPDAWQFPAVRFALSAHLTLMLLISLAAIFYAKSGDHSPVEANPGEPYSRITQEAKESAANAADVMANTQRLGGVILLTGSVCFFGLGYIFTNACERYMCTPP